MNFRTIILDEGGILKMKLDAEISNDRLDACAHYAGQLHNVDYWNAKHSQCKKCLALAKHQQR